MLAPEQFLRNSVTPALTHRQRWVNRDDVARPDPDVEEARARVWKAAPTGKKPHDARGATGIPDENIGGHFHTKGVMLLPAEEGLPGSFLIGEGGEKRCDLLLEHRDITVHNHP